MELYKCVQLIKRSKNKFSVRTIVKRRFLKRPHIPFAFVIDYEFENTMPVRGAECKGIFPGLAHDGVKRGTDVGI